MICSWQNDGGLDKPIYPISVIKEWPSGWGESILPIQ